MKRIYLALKFTFLVTAILIAGACNDLMDEPAENKTFTEETDYALTNNMIQPLMGVYATFQDYAWEVYPLISVRGDDVNAGGLGDQQDFGETDRYNYNKDYWMYNSVWQGLYNDAFVARSAIDEIELYQQNGANAATASQYIAEAKTIEAFSLFQLSRVWGSIILPRDPNPTSPLNAQVSTKDQVMQSISDSLEMIIDALPDMHPNERTDIRGGVTKYTALAIKALADLELKNYQEVADATGEIISSGKFALAEDYYNLFKIPGKLSQENLFEMQYSDFGQASGDTKGYLYAFFGPENWTPKVEGSGAGWGFFEPSLKYIKFMLDRGETERLETSVLFTNRGIAEIKKDAKYATLPAFVTNTTREGDIINDYGRAMFASGKHYLPSAQLTPGRADYGTNKNFIVIRYAEILLMHAEALTQGATSAAMTADAAVNLVRERAGLTPLSGVTLQQVMDEKFAELAMEWGTRYYDMIRLERYQELSYDGRTFTEDKIFLPYPQNQVDLLPSIRSNQ
ncbi:MAG TPA: RagB/SusD family nutrient uptake outer membrane protein [Prolixibacteraceae bacterium]|nr:RagB/SusD family nutrient uptake outer membrane protein [Prolixibacteraceae bacterium]